MPQLLLNPTSLSASTSGSARLNEALLLLEGRLAAWSRDPVAFHALLQQVFGVPPSRSAESAALLTTISGSGLGISLQILDSTTIDGLIAAYTSAAPDGDERIYLNASWLDLATPEQIEVVLLEEIGHAIDEYLNDTNDTSGDEGAAFSALLRGKTPDPGAYRENDQRILNIDGVAVAVEASTDTTRPAGSLGSFATTPAYAREGGNNPFGIPEFGYVASPALADADADGDLDLFIGNIYGNTLFFRNTGSASAPAYTQQEGTTPFGISDVGSFAIPALADIDGDGDLDLFIGKSYGATLFFRNTGSASAPAYTQEGGNTPYDGFFGIPDVGRNAIPSFADADGDGDLDLFIGERLGKTYFYRNTGSASAPAYILERGNTPQGSVSTLIPDVDSFAHPSIADIDDDGDLDLFIGESWGKTLFFRNTGSANAPAYSQEGGDTPFGITDVGSGAAPTLADSDGDGDLDLFIGNNDGNTYFFRNTAATRDARKNTQTDRPKTQNTQNPPMSLHTPPRRPGLA